MFEGCNAQEKENISMKFDKEFFESIFRRWTKNKIDWLMVLKKT